MTEAAVKLDDGMTEAERHYFQSNGDVNEALSKETPAEPQPAAPAPAEQPAVDPAAAAPAPDATAGNEPDDDADEGADATAAQPGQPQKPRRRVSRREYESEREARLTAERQLQEQTVRNARVEERLTLLQQALQEPAQTEQEQQDDPRPDPNQDIFGYTAWLERRFNAMDAKVNGYEQQITTGQAEMDAERRYFDSLNSFAGTRPDFINAYNTAIRGRAAQLIGETYADVTDEQLDGIRNGSIRIPQAITEQLRQEERGLYKTAFEQNRDPAAVLYRYAQSFGYRPQQANGNGAAQPQQQRAATPALGGAPAAPAQNGAARPTAQQATPTATDVVASIQRGQNAALSLSNAAGSSPATELTPQALAEMSEDQFAELFNELQARGDKQKLMSLFGS